MTVAELFVLARDITVTGLLLVAIIGGFRGWYVWKWYADEQRERIRDLEKRLERAEQLAVGGTALARRATSLAERAGGPDG